MSSSSSVGWFLKVEFHFLCVSSQCGDSPLLTHSLGLTVVSELPRVPARSEFLSWVCLGVLSLCEGSSVCIIPLENDLAQGAVPPLEDYEGEARPNLRHKMGAGKTSQELSEVGRGRSG